MPTYNGKALEVLRKFALSILRAALTNNAQSDIRPMELKYNLPGFHPRFWPSPYWPT